ncbi:unnamed protein product [Effrenium voratum]|nr:unnamed protein product [Effrenium voratum]
MPLAAVPVLCLDPQLRVTVWNDAAAQATGRAAAEVCGRPLLDFLSLEAGRSLTARLEAAPDERFYISELPTQSERLQLHLLPCRGKGFLGFALGKERRLSTHSLFSFGDVAAVSEGFETCLHASSAAVFSVNGKGAITQWNAAMAALMPPQMHCKLSGLSVLFACRMRTCCHLQLACP